MLTPSMGAIGVKEGRYGFWVIDWKLNRYFGHQPVERLQHGLIAVIYLNCKCMTSHLTAGRSSRRTAFGSPGDPHQRLYTAGCLQSVQARLLVRPGHPKRLCLEFMARSPSVLTKYDEAEMACVSNVTHQNLDTTHSFVENHTQSFDFA